jgi:hypothetical protein
MVSHDCERNIIIDTTTGFPPLLTTVAGTYNYSLPLTVRKLKTVFIDTDEDNYDDYGTYDCYQFKDKTFYWIPVTSRPKSLSNAATITFRSDPGSTTAKYYYEGYRAPTEITSVEVELDIEEEFHDMFLDGVLHRVRLIEYGDQTNWLSWRNERVPTEYWAEMNKQPTRSTLMPYRYA